MSSCSGMAQMTSPRVLTAQPLMSKPLSFLSCATDSGISKRSELDTFRYSNPVNCSITTRTHVSSGRTQEKTRKLTEEQNTNVLQGIQQDGTREIQVGEVRHAVEGQWGTGYRSHRNCLFSPRREGEPDSFVSSRKSGAVFLKDFRGNLSRLEGRAFPEGHRVDEGALFQNLRELRY